LKNVTKTWGLRVLNICHVAATSRPRHRHEGGQCHMWKFPPAPCWRVLWRGPAKIWRGPPKYWRGMSSEHNFTTLTTHAYVYFDITFDVLLSPIIFATTLRCFLWRPGKQCCFQLTFLMATVAVVLDIFRNIATSHQPLHIPISMFILTSNLTPMSFSMSLFASSITGVTWWCVIQRRRHDTLGVEKNAYCPKSCYLKHLIGCAICQWRRCGRHCLKQTLGSTNMVANICGCYLQCFQFHHIKLAMFMQTSCTTTAMIIMSWLVFSWMWWLF